MNMARQKMLTILFLALLVATQAWLLNFKPLSTLDLFFLLGRSGLLVFFVLTAPPPQKEARGMGPWIYLIMSYLPFMLFKEVHFAATPLLLVVLSGTMLFYATILLMSYLSLGKNFSIYPQARGVTKTGLYSLVRHPVYVICFAMSAAYVVANYSASNSILLAIMAVGLVGRSKIEEAVLGDDPEYQTYRDQVRGLSGIILLLLPVFTLIAVKEVERRRRPPDGPNPLVVGTNIPFYHLSPLKYDDWTSVFVGNHIWARLLPEKDRGSVRSVATDLQESCLDTKCRRMRIVLPIQELSRCEGGVLDLAQVKSELERILKYKSWILPHHTLCQSTAPHSLCIEFDGVPSVRQRLEAVYFRFGWSKHERELFRRFPIGTGSYCLTELDLKPRFRAILKSKARTVILTDETETGFDFAIHSPLNKEQVSINASTPLAYYVVTNPRLREYALPWNTEEGKGLLARFLRSQNLLYETNLHTPFIPDGQGLHGGAKRAPKKLNFVIPNYLTDCPQLAQSLMKSWSVHVSCLDITKYTQEVVAGRKEWDGFLSPLSPGAPYSGALYDQYFSGTSIDSWFKVPGENNLSYYLVGVGKTEVAGRKGIVCGLRPNFLGLSDVLVDDVVFCD